MKKEKLLNLMRKHLICNNEEAIESINFVMELLEEVVSHTQDTEPYATSTIDRMLKAIGEVKDLEDMFY
jgi:ferritin